MHKSVAKNGGIICWHTASCYIALKKILHHYLAKGKGQKTVGIPVLPAPLFLLIAGQLVLSTSLFKCSLFRFNYINFPHLGSEGNFKKKVPREKKTPRKRPGRNFLPLCLACSKPQQSFPPSLHASGAARGGGKPPVFPNARFQILRRAPPRAVCCT